MFNYDDGVKWSLELCNLIIKFYFLLVSHLLDDSGTSPVNDGSSGRRVRRSEAILSQAAECVRSGQTFQMVSDMFSIPISTIR